MFSRQFNTGSEDDKQALIDQLSESFHQKDLAWIHSPSVHVQRTTLHPADIDWNHREEWAATHEPGLVREKRKAIKHGDDKPVVVVDRPRHDKDFIMDGHHHAEAYTQLLGKDPKDQNKHVRSLHGTMPAYRISVPTVTGPWDELHTKQEHNKYA